MSDVATDATNLHLRVAASASSELTEHSGGAEARLPGIGVFSAAAKRSLDVIASAAALLLLSPLFLVIGIALARTGRPILFAQERVGLGGRAFRCLKFRSMIPGAEEILDRLLQQDPALQQEWQQAQKLKVDFRITRLGALLRKWSLDELPQLWNVLRGDMSLVGPRPALLNQFPMYGASARYYTAVRPGITGLWQVTCRGDGDFQRRIELDCEYVRTFSFWNDCLVLLKTVRVVLSREGAY